MRLQTRLGFMLTALLALAPPATATSPPDMNSSNSSSSIKPQEQYSSTPAITAVTLNRTDQDLAIGDFYLGASTQHDIGRTTIGSSPPNTGDATAGPPDKIEAPPGMRFAKNSTKNNVISARFMRSTGVDTGQDTSCGEPTNAPEYNLLCRQSAGRELM